MHHARIEMADEPRFVAAVGRILLMEKPPCPARRQVGQAVKTTAPSGCMNALFNAQRVADPFLVRAAGPALLKLPHVASPGYS